MKKVVSILLALCLVLTLVGCTPAKPEEVVEKFCEALKNYDLQSFSECFEEGVVDAEGFYESYGDYFTGIDSENAAKIAEYMIARIKSMTYKIGEITVDGDTATAAVEFTYADLTPVFSAILTDYFSQAFVLAYGGATEDELAQLMVTIMYEKFETVEAGTATETAVLDCVKTSDGWKIAKFSSANEEIMARVMSCNIEAAITGAMIDLGLV